MILKITDTDLIKNCSYLYTTPGTFMNSFDSISCQYMHTIILSRNIVSNYTLKRSEFVF